MKSRSTRFTLRRVPVFIIYPIVLILVLSRLGDALLILLVKSLP